MIKLRSKLGHLATLAALLAIQPLVSYGHGFEGDRFFPPTITSDDPFAADDLIQTFTIVKNSALSDNPGREIDLTTEFDKEIFPKFALAITKTYSDFHPDGGPSYDGFSNWQIGGKYQVYENAKHEFIFSVGASIDLGGTGRDIANSYTTYTPNLYYGKGFGDLPSSLSALRPIAITGVIGYDIPSEGISQNVLNWSGSIQYSLPYLEQNVADIGIPYPVRNMIPVVEYSILSPTNHNAGGDYTPQVTTGTINPGVMWETKYAQFGVEALIPINQATGPDVGAIFQVHVFLDDLFPDIFGKPLIGGQN